MSPPKSHYIKVATKTLSLNGSQSIDYAPYTLSDPLILCAFVAELDFSEDSKNITLPHILRVGHSI